MRCANCSTDLRNNAKFCSNCGRKLNIVRVTVEGDVIRPPSLPSGNRAVQPHAPLQPPHRPKSPPHPGGQNHRGPQPQPNNQQVRGQNRHRPNAEHQRRTHLGIPTNLGTDGALVVYGSQRLQGTEVSIYTRYGSGTNAKAVITQRRVLGESVYAAVFPRITTGTYTVWTPAPGVSSVETTVFSGNVAQVDWRKY